MELSVSALSRLSYQYLSIAELISDVDDSRIHLHPSPGKWSIHDNIAHLARYNIVFQERMQKILKEESPAFDRYTEETDDAFPSWQKKSRGELLESISTERKKITLMSSSLRSEELVRAGTHPRFGKLTIIDWMEFFLLHEAHHVFTIFQLKNDVTLKAQ